MGETRNAYRTLVGKPEAKGPLGRPSSRIKMDLREDGMGWIELIWLRIGTAGGLL
jgi:hypothetical protein